MSGCGVRQMSRRTTPEIVLHLGAHRTGSTRLQIILDANSDILAEAGIAALTPPRPGKRISLTIRDAIDALPGAQVNFVKRFRKLQSARALFHGLIADGKPDTAVPKLIVSEENLLGPVFEATGEGLYSSAFPRLAAFHQMLGRSPSEIHLTLRSYDTFLVSVYAMRAVYGGKIPLFDDIRNELLAVRRGWPDLVADVTRAFPGTPIKLTRVEHDPVKSRVRDLVGFSLFEKFRLGGEERPNMAPTVEAMRASAGIKGHAALDDLIARCADGARFDPLTGEESARLVRRYANDLAVAGL